MQKRPTPLAMTRSRCAGAAAIGLALATLGACANADPNTSGAGWRRSHAGVERSLIQAVNWPGTRVSRVEADAHGFRTVLKFPGDDSDMGAIVQVALASAGPCKAVPYLVTDSGTYHPDPSTYGDTAFAEAECTPIGKNAWKLTVNMDKIDGYASYAERRNGVLLILTTYDTWTHPNFKAIAATLHPLDDHQLGSLL
jgi:hypothetical protein